MEIKGRKGRGYCVMLTYEYNLVLLGLYYHQYLQMGHRQQDYMLKKKMD